jgi:hypothetical protein
MLIARPKPHARHSHDGRMRRCLACGFAAWTVLLAAPAAQAAEGSSLRGLRAPPLIEFMPGDPYRAGASLWQPGLDAQSESAPQPSALYGLRERSTVASSRLSYRYSDSVTGVLETGPTAPDPYASNAVSGQVVRSFGSGLGVGLGLRQRHTGSNVLALGVQQDWGSFSGGYTMYSGRTEAAPSPSHRIALNFSYGNRSSIGLSYTTGRDLQAGMLPFTPGVDSRDLALTGYHWLAPQWALTYDVVNSEQAAYRRQGLRFGIRHTF